MFFKKECYSIKLVMYNSVTEGSSCMCFIKLFPKLNTEIANSCKIHI